ncbi:mitochondrial oxoglutarate transporter [Pseudoscourfieldia marina]
MTDFLKAAKPYVIGGASGMAATCVIQPIDIVKVRLQLGATGGPFGVAASIIKNEGFGTLYTGLSAGLLRQATYTTARLGLFKNISEELQNRNGKGKPLPLHLKALAGLSAGGLAAMVGSPADLSLIRMQADGTLPVAERRNYKGVVDAMGAIVKEDGIGGLFRGAGPTIVRAMALNMGMLASNEQAKEILVANGVTGMNATLGASALAGFVASAFSLPFDYVKTQLQKQKPDANGKLPYAGTLDCAMKTFAEGGPLKFYTGFPTYYVRIAPHAMFTLIFQDALTKFVKKQGI